MSYQTSFNSQSTVKLNATQKPVCKGGYHFNLKLITAVVFACACLIQGVSNSYTKTSSDTKIESESNSLIHQQSLQAWECPEQVCRRKSPIGSRKTSSHSLADQQSSPSETETCSGFSRCRVPGGGRLS